MKVFLSWSGPRSRYIAQSLHSWLPNLLQRLDPWMSKEDIATGARWLPEISVELSAAKVGILCITPENQSNPWLVFEAGALSKTLSQTYVCPMVFDIEPGKLSGPITQFQAGRLDKAGVSKLMETLNLALGEQKLDASRLNDAFEIWWPQLEKNLKSVPLNEVPVTTRQKEDVLEEILELSREQLRRENLRLEHSQARDERLDRILPVFEQMLGAAKDMQRRGKELTTRLQSLQIPPELISDLFGGGLAMQKMQEAMEFIKEGAEISRAEKQQLLNPPERPTATGG
jgi:hypothetical protein